MKEQYRLPFQKSFISSNSSVFLADSLLRTNAKEDYCKFLCSTYVNCYFDYESDNDKFALSRYDYAGTKRWILVYQSIDLRKDTFHTWHVDMLTLLKKLISIDLYVYGRCNRSMLNLISVDRDERVDYMLTGYDDKKHAFEVQIFDNNNQHLFCEIDYDSFCTSLFVTPRDNILLNSFTYNKEIQIEIDYAAMFNEIESYLKSRNAQPEYVRGRVYGINAILRFFEFVQEQMIFQQEIDEKYLAAFLEHKILMKERIEYLVSQNVISSYFLGEANKVYELGQEVYQCGKRYNDTFDMFLYGIKLLDLVKESIDIEKTYLFKVLSEINRI